MARGAANLCRHRPPDAAGAAAHERLDQRPQTRQRADVLRERQRGSGKFILVLKIAGRFVALLRREIRSEVVGADSARVLKSDRRLPDRGEATIRCGFVEPPR